MTKLGEFTESQQSKRPTEEQVPQDGVILQHDTGLANSVNLPHWLPIIGKLVGSGGLKSHEVFKQLQKMLEFCAVHRAASQ